MSRRLVSILVFLGVLGAALSAAAVESPDVAFATIEDHVTRVVDGDTLELRSGETVRLLGIDTPETNEPLYLDAKLFLFRLVCHKTVRLELDQVHYDVYYRLLAHVYVETEDGWILANAEMVRAGLADLLFIPPNGRYKEYFEITLYEAMLARRGLWGTVPGTLSVAELEADLMTCITEVVAVAFHIGRVEETRNELVLYAAEGAFGFNVRIPLEETDAFTLGDLDALIGVRATAVGVLGCELRLGPYIAVDSPGQLVLHVE